MTDQLHTKRRPDVAHRYTFVLNDDRFHPRADGRPGFRTQHWSHFNHQRVLTSHALPHFLPKYIEVRLLQKQIGVGTFIVLLDFNKLDNRYCRKYPQKNCEQAAVGEWSL